ncbi:DUF3883 domain-containing protein [Alkalihalobacillus trypoxylicola]|uniref:Protein NO VEIN C-terminal domain-containing protein n=1 Tax=Alkalihalobacillus trypoxylicola TaxID=519424 RepID=A0A161P6L9_9BACI|nr:DUF3883 domain-containing protein [Alkalihalobacillus trypoxylicola]KYG27727.1 hypothetical protein AZF04_11100 [Alkalihalobacillus trypoxylicola]
MENNHKLALIISYYLSRFDKTALINLNYDTNTQAFQEIGETLKVKPNTIKNMRDEFDPLHPNSRKGWYQRELRPSRLEVLERYSHFSEDALTEVVKDILRDYASNSSIKENIQTYINDIENDDVVKETSNHTYTTRGITGKKAEELFEVFFREGEIEGLTGDLIDRREDGCGYDFEMEESPFYVFEIKGLLVKHGGILFTDKEWSVAKKFGKRYYLIVINNIAESPSVTIIRNPYECLNPSKSVYTSIDVNWSVKSNQIFKN